MAAARLAYTQGPEPARTRAFPPMPSPTDPAFPFADPIPSGEGAETIVSFHQDLTLEHVFTSREVALVQRVQKFLPVAGAYAADLRRALSTGFRGLGSIALAMESYPSLREKRQLGTRVRTLESLMQTLIDRGEHGLEWALPTKAILSRTFAIAKVNFFTSLAYCVDACKQVEDRGPLLHEIAAGIEEAVFTRLAEELYTAFVTSRVTTLQVKTQAAQNLVALWEGRVRFATDRFCPLLRSAWAARTRAPRAFGTMMGASEMFAMLFADCDPKFIDWFTGHAGKSEQLHAFEEFLFDLPYESLERVRLRMAEDGRNVVGPERGRALPGLPAGRAAPACSATPRRSTPPTAAGAARPSTAPRWGRRAPSARPRPTCWRRCCSTRPARARSSPRPRRCEAAPLPPLPAAVSAPRAPPPRAARPPPGPSARCASLCALGPAEPGATGAAALFPLEAEPFPLAGSDALGLTVTWTGVAGFVLEREGVRIAFDPFVTRPGLWATLLRRPASDQAAVARAFSGLAAAFAGHTHHDHAMDLPALAQASPAARLVGGRVTVDLCRRSGVGAGAPASRPWTARASRWAPSPWRPWRPSTAWCPWSGTWTGSSLAEHGLPAHALPLSPGRGLRLARGGRRPHRSTSRGAPGLRDTTLGRQGPVDVLVACLAARAGTPRYLERLGERLRPRVLVPCHHDDFFRPLSALPGPSRPSAGRPSCATRSALEAAHGTASAPSLGAPAAW